MARASSVAPFLLVLCALAVLVGLIPYAPVVFPLPWFKATQGGIVAIGFIVTGLIALIQCRVSERGAPAVLATTYFFSFPLMIANLVLFPGSLPYGSAETLSRAAAWFLIVQYTGFALGGCLYPVFRDRYFPRRNAGWIAPVALGASVLTAVLVFLVTARWGSTDVYANHSIIPIVGPAVVLLYVVAIARLMRMPQKSALEDWYIAAHGLTLLGAAFIQLNIARYSVPWYYNGVVVTVASWCLLGYLVKAGYDRYERAVTSVAELTEEAAAEQERFAETVNCAAIGIAHVTPAGRLSFANDWVKSQPAHLVAELVEGRPAAPGSVERRISIGDGLDCWYEMSVSETQQNGDESYRVLVINDITARKRAEAAMHHMNEIKSQFIATMSHEIRTPLNGVVGISELFKRTSPLTEKQRRFAETIDISAQSLLALVNDILDFSKIEAAKLEIERSCFDLVHLTGEVALAHEAAAQAKGLRFERYVAADLAGGMYGDPMRLRQVLDNLLASAIRFTGTGRVALSVESVGSAGSDVNIRFAVEDSAKAAEREDLRGLFDAFARNDSVTGWASRGAGLGLAIAKRLVELMGGRIELEALPGGGSRLAFTVQLERENAPGAAFSIAPQEFAAPHDPRSARILVAEDNEVNRMLVFAQLEELGYRAEYVEDGAAAVTAAAAANGGFAMIFMDTQMPGLDGLQATAAIRKAEAGSGRHTPIIAMTANASPEHRRHCLEAGMDDHLAKPVLLSGIESMLRRWLAEPAS